MILGLTFKQSIKYMALPGILPRLRELFGSGFSHIAFFMALVYGAVRLLPQNHPYLLPANIGRFNVLHVMSEAANNLTLSTKNIDQAILFFTILLGFAIGLVQIALLGVSLFANPSLAAGPVSVFTTEFPKQDLAFMFMDMVFGVPDVFNSCVASFDCTDINNNPISGVSNNWMLQQLGFPFPVHYALHNMIRIYNTGLIIVALFITLYFVTTVVLETAQTGTPFGKRFNKVWAPLRLVVAFGLLMPLGIGLNSSQYIVLYAAKMGSGFATNGWNKFNDTLIKESMNGTSELLGSKERKIIATPKIPEVTGLLQFMYTAYTCKMIEKESNGTNIEPYIVRDPLDGVSYMKTEGLDYKDMVKFANGDTQVIIRFGTHGDSSEHKHNKGHVIPTCGELVLKLTDPRLPAANDAERKREKGKYSSKGTETMQRYYWYIINELWFTTFRLSPPADTDIDEDRNDLQLYYNNDVQAAMLDPSLQSLETRINSTKGAINEQAEDGRWVMDTGVRQKGWAAAGIWYNRIAEMNGAITAAVLNIPTPTRYPMVMEEVFMAKRQKVQNPKTMERYNPEIGDNKFIKLARSEDLPKAKKLWRAFHFWNIDGASTTPATGNAFVDAINTLLGTDGLINMRKNADVHPLAQLVAVGRSLIESSIRNLGNATILAAGGAAASTVDNFFGNVASLGVGFTVKVAMLGMTIGFVLFYIVPFMPFIYFFFAVGGWVKGIFEALLGAPLWALAHLRIDGNGLPGSAAVDGYFLILEVFLRPLLTIFGLIASISIFSALVSVLNQTWDLVITNLGGLDMRGALVDTGNATKETLVEQPGFIRGAVDQFFFTVVYAIIVYMMGMASFKLIDNVPNNILRWMGKSVAAFNDKNENPAEAMAGKASMGANQVLEQAGGGIEGSLSQVAKLGNKPPGAR